MKMKLLLAGQIINIVGCILLIVKTCMKDAFPEPLRYIGAVCLLIGLITNLMLLRDARKRQKQTEDGNQQE